MNLRGLAVAVGLAMLLAGCGDDTASDEPAETPPAAAGEEPAAPVVAENLPADEPAESPAGETPAVAEGPPADAPAAGAPAAEAPAGPVQAVVATHQLSDIYTALQVDPAAIADPHDYIPIAMEICGDKPTCQVGIWTDPDVTPTALPVRVAQLKYQMFTYGRNRETGYEKSLWNCFDYPEQESEGCIPRPLR
jgi:hypothetical protein